MFPNQGNIVLTRPSGTPAITEFAGSYGPPLIRSKADGLLWNLGADDNPFPVNFVNVKGFGAVGDGVVDDTSAIQTAVAAGKHVFVPDGNFITTGDIVLATAGQRLFGLGRQSKITNTGASAGNVVKVTADDCCVSGLWLRGNGVDATGELDGNVILFSGVTGGVASDNIIDRPSKNGKGVAINASSEIEVFRNRIQNGIDQSKDISLEGNCNRNRIFFNECLSSNMIGIQLVAIDSGETQHFNNIAGNYVTNKVNAVNAGIAHGIVINTEIVGTGTARFNTVEDNICTAIDGAAVYISGSAATSCVDNSVVGNLAYDCVQVGTAGTLNDSAFLSNCNNNLFEGNHVIGGGITSTASAYRVTGDDCAIVGCVSNSFTGTGIRTSGNRTSVSGCKVIIASGADRGVYESAGTGCTYSDIDVYYITGNGAAFGFFGTGAKVKGCIARRASATAANGFEVSGTDTYLVNCSSTNSNTPVSITGTGYIEDCDFAATTQAISAAGDTITAMGHVRLIANNTAGSITLTSTPTIASGFNGQKLILTNVGSQDVVLQDQGTLAGSNLRLTGASVTLTPRDSVSLVFNTTNDDWVQVTPVANIV